MTSHDSQMINFLDRKIYDAFYIIMIFFIMTYVIPQKGIV